MNNAGLGMRLLISPKNKMEAVEAIAGGVDIIDVKNPAEGSLGANFPWVIREIKALLPESVELSATIGDMEFKPGTAAQAALGAATLDVDYVKAGLFGTKTETQATRLMEAVVRAVAEWNNTVRVVAAAYADAERIKGLDPLKVPEVVLAAEADVAMVDTAIKDGKKLFDFLKDDQLHQLIDFCHDHGLLAALAGSLQKKDVLRVKKLGADIVGVRGAVCVGDRINGKVDRQLVQELVAVVR